MLAWFPSNEVDATRVDMACLKAVGAAAAIARWRPGWSFLHGLGLVAVGRRDAAADGVDVHISSASLPFVARRRARG
jgi:hypothetical protein